ncbi:ROK family protein [Paenibacillus doosanensis]|uniref:ROK family protein n=1 Tax=Paenibacillus doosanensis TaxID=1229154 RepID=UPI00217FBD9F|nr:ROK family protein [Paenibacillus doosanensis]MCS7464799.1 ROK family protein [Paenibacillus doosanensis]
MSHIVFDADASYAVGVDVGGTKINAGIVDARGEVLLTRSIATQAAEREVPERIILAVEAVIAEFGSTAAEAMQEAVRLKGIGVGTAGQVDWEQGSIRYSSGLIPGYGGTPLKRLLQERFGLPVWVDNDVNVLALTERTLGAGRGVSNLLCLALGTGVGGAAVIDGKLVHGTWGGAGEFGHLSVDFDGPPCVCGSRGCLEQYASGTGIAKRMADKLAALGITEPAIDARTTVDRWLDGDPAASEVMRETFSALGSAIASLIHTFNPEVIVIGGGVAEAGEALLSEITREVSRRTMPSMLQGVKITPAYRGNWSGMIGAALQVWAYEKTGTAS